MSKLILIGAISAFVFTLPFPGQRLWSQPVSAEHVKIDAEGPVDDVACSGNELTLKISARNGRFNLHARDYTRVEISEDVPFEAGEFRPCTDLSGKTAKITFVTVDRKSYDGEIQSIEVEK
ncbi:MAG: hypothetical protein WCD49_17910 [Candidatus Acidiferrales bacterium]